MGPPDVMAIFEVGHYVVYRYNLLLLSEEGDEVNQPFTILTKRHSNSLLKRITKFSISFRTVDPNTITLRETEQLS